jgi:hypothetical protein
MELQSTIASLYGRERVYEIVSDLIRQTGIMEYNGVRPVHH